MGRIFSELGIKDEGDSEATKELYHRIELVKAYDADEQELNWLSNGVPSEAAKIKEMSIRDYLALVKFVLKKNQDKPQKNGDNE